MALTEKVEMQTPKDVWMRVRWLNNFEDPSHSLGRQKRSWQSTKLLLFIHFERNYESLSCQYIQDVHAIGEFLMLLFALS